MRLRVLFAASIMALAALASAPAEAGLAGSTVIANSWFGGTNPQPTACDPQGNATCNILFVNNSPTPSVPVAFGQDFLTLTTPTISDTQITILNNSDLPFCTTALPCNDVFDGWVFTFLGGQPIKSVTVDPSSSPGFLPVNLAFVNNNTVSYHVTGPVGNFTQYTGNSIYVNLAGDAPALNDQLVLDITTGGVPEPSTWALMLVGFGGLGWAALRKRTLRAA